MWPSHLQITHHPGHNISSGISLSCPLCFTADTALFAASLALDLSLVNVLRSDFVNIIMIVGSSFSDDTAGICRIWLIRVRIWICFSSILGIPISSFFQIFLFCHSLLMSRISWVIIVSVCILMIPPFLSTRFCRNESLSSWFHLHHFVLLHILFCLVLYS